MSSLEEYLSYDGSLGLTVFQDGMMVKVDLKYLSNNLVKTEKTLTVYIKGSRYW